MTAIKIKMSCQMSNRRQVRNLEEPSDHQQSKTSTK